MNKSNDMVNDAVGTDYSQVSVGAFSLVFCLHVDELVKYAYSYDKHRDHRFNQLCRQSKQDYMHLTVSVGKGKDFLSDRFQCIKREIFGVCIADSCQSEPFTNADLYFSSDEQFLLSLLHCNQHSLKQFTRDLKTAKLYTSCPGLVQIAFQANHGERLMQKSLLIRNVRNIKGLLVFCSAHCVYEATHSDSSVAKNEQFLMLKAEKIELRKAFSYQLLYLLLLFCSFVSFLGGGSLGLYAKSQSV